MADKMICYVCDSCTSSVLRATEIDEPCPHCGASCELQERIGKLARSLVSDGALNALRKLGRDLSDAQREASRFRTAMQDVQRIASDALTEGC